MVKQEIQMTYSRITWTSPMVCACGPMFPQFATQHFIVPTYNYFPIKQSLQAYKNQTTMSDLSHGSETYKQFETASNFYYINNFAF